MTDDYSQTVANPDGSFGYTQTVAPVRTKQNNAWVPIDTSLVRASDGSWHPKAAAVSLTISGGGTAPLIVLDDNAGHTETLTWPTTLPTPQIKGNAAIYSEVLPGVDLRVAADSLGFRQVLIVKNAKAAANPALASIRLGLAGKNLVLSVNSDNQLHGTDAKGATVFAGGTPGMWDSTPASATAALSSTHGTEPPVAATATDPADGPSPAAVQATMKSTLTAGGIDISTNVAMLTDPHIHFPVYIDPDNAGQPLIAHAEIWQALPTRPGDPTACCNLNVTRVGWNTSSPGAVRSLFQFANKVPWDATILSSNFKLTTEEGTTAPAATEVWQLDQFPIDSNGNPTGSLLTWNSALGSGGAWTPFDSNVKPIGSFTIGGAHAGYTPNVDNRDQMQNVVNNNGPYVTLGLKASAETAAAGGWQSFWWNSSNSGDNANLSVSYRMPPWITRVWTDPGTISGNSCDTDANNPGYITKTVGGLIDLHIGVADIDPLSVSVMAGIEDLNGDPNSKQAISWAPPANAPGNSVEALTGASFSQAGGSVNQRWSLTDGHRYSVSASTFVNIQTSPLTPPPPKCYFTVAFTSPDPPSVSSQDFPPVGSTPKLLATAPGAIQIAGHTKGVASAGFEYVVNGDSSAAQATNLPNPGPDPVSGAGHVSADGNGNSTINLPLGTTQMGTNSLLVRAVDVAGNRSPFTAYDFFTPGNPDLHPAYGNVTGDGMADIVAVGPDGHGAQHLVVFPSTVDPNTANTANATEAAPASAAPDGASWANTLFTHRGADRASPTDDLFAYSTATHQLDYYLNSVVRKAGVLPADQFVQTHQILVARPPCTATPEICARYNPNDWSGVLNIVALGPAAGGTAGTFGGKTSFVTVEDDGNGGGNLWLFSPGPAAGQLKNPQLIGTSDLRRSSTLMPHGWNWATVDLIAPGSATPGGLPDLWARDRSTGTLIQFTNVKNSAGVEDPASLGSLDAAVPVGNPGQFSTKDFPTLISGGSPAVDGSNGAVPPGSNAGSTHQTGARALWSLNTKGQLQLVPGPITTDSTLPHRLWNTTADSWINGTGVTAVNGTAVGTTTGPILLGIDQNNGTQMCLDLANGATDNGTMVRSWGCNGTTAQIWTFNSNGTITSALNPNRCVDILRSSVTSDGTMIQTPVQIWDCNGWDNQKWTLRNSTNASSSGHPGWLNFYNEHSGRCLDNPYNNTSWQQMWIYDCSDNTAQQWLAPSPTGSPQQVEAEDLWVENASPTPTAQSNCCGGSWSNNAQVYFPGTAPNQSFTLDWYVPQTGTYTINPAMTKSFDYGITQLTIDSGPPLPNKLDGFQSAGVSTAPFAFGRATLTAGTHKFTFTTTGTNPASSGNRYLVGVDALNLTPVVGTGPTSALALSVNGGSPPLAVTADASASYGGGADITSYTFDFGDGTIIGPQGSAIVQHAYTTPASSFLVKLTATDRTGISATTVKQVTTSLAIPTGMTSSDNTTSTPCNTDPAHPAVTTTTTPTLSATLPGPAVATVHGEFEMSDTTSGSTVPPLLYGRPGSASTTGSTATVTTPALANGHVYAWAARAADGAGGLSATSSTCYLQVGTATLGDGTSGLLFDNTIYSASNITWTGPQTKLVWQTDGNLVIYDKSGKALWASNTPGHPGATLVPQIDGNLVIYASQPSISPSGVVSGSVLWATNTMAAGSWHLVVRADGNVVIEGSTGIAFSTNTYIGKPTFAGALISAVPTAGNPNRQVCVDDLNGNTTNSAAVVAEYDCNHGWTQGWQFRTDGTIRAMGQDPATAPAKCLDTGGFNTSGSKVTLYDCQAGNGNQVWQVIPSTTNPGQISLKNPLSGMCLDDLNGATNDGNAFQLYGCLDNANQHFLAPTGANETQSSEGESIWGSASGGTMVIQANCCNAAWSNNAQQQLLNSTAGSSMTLRYFVANAGSYLVAPVMTKAVDYGIVQMNIDGGTALPNSFDGYNNSVTTQQFTFGKVNLAAGMHTFTFTVGDTNASTTGNRYNAGVDVLALLPASNPAPTPALKVPNMGIVNQPVTADATASFPGMAAITGYSFDFGDGTTPVTGTATTAAHNYTTPRTYTVTVTVTDSNGSNAKTTQQVVVLSGPPIPNGNFESGNLSGWGDSYQATVTTTNPHSGTFAGQLNAGTSTPAGLEQVVTGLTPNTTYTLTGWVRTDGGITTLGAKLYENTNDDTEATTTATTWTLLTDQFTTGATNITVDIYCYRPTAGISACDDITLEPTPAPGAVANPDLETGNLSGWSDSYQATVTTTNPHSGTFAGQLNAGTSTPAGLEQVVTGLTPNTTYTLTGWVRTDGGTTTLGAKLYENTNDDTEATTTNTGWTQLTDQFTTGATNTTVDIYC
ncbi:MAG: PKD domain-containing protein, partial [Kribbellaceae bacterium]|nr:PKD domain-containing protein [Kribbellaceae bacterium]